MAEKTSPNDKRVKPPSNSYSFASTTPVTKNCFAVTSDNPQEEAEKIRKFSLIAYTGDVIEQHWWWDRVIFDIESMQLAADSIPALLDHDRDKRVGYSTEHEFNAEKGFSVSGIMLSNDNAMNVINDADEGFPWQVSVDIRPVEIEYFADGYSTTVNGRKVSGPIYVFRRSKIVEFSFTATGWDAGTTATVMSNDPTKPEDSGMTQANTNQNTDDLDKIKAELAATKKELRMSNVAKLFSDCGIQFDAESDDVKSVLAMSDDTFAAYVTTTKSMASKFSSKTAPNNVSKPDPAGLFSDVATDGKSHFGNQPTGSPSGGSVLLDSAKKFCDQYGDSNKRRTL